MYMTLHNTIFYYYCYSLFSALYYYHFDANRYVWAAYKFDTLTHAISACTNWCRPAIRRRKNTKNHPFYFASFLPCVCAAQQFYIIIPFLSSSSSLKLPFFSAVSWPLMETIEAALALTKHNRSCFYLLLVLYLQCTH